MGTPVETKAETTASRSAPFFAALTASRTTETALTHSDRDGADCSMSKRRASKATAVDFASLRQASSVKAGTSVLATQRKRFFANARSSRTRSARRLEVLTLRVPTHLARHLSANLWSISSDLPAARRSRATTSSKGAPVPKSFSTTRNFATNSKVVAMTLDSNPPLYCMTIARTWATVLRKMIRSCSGSEVSWSSMAPRMASALNSETCFEARSNNKSSCGGRRPRSTARASSNSASGSCESFSASSKSTSAFLRWSSGTA
mmetsp:Transcript_6465/g.20737  ORF Transcript_6465/g.20737 Transcript_6465/m.20737 type:complete len:262 (+) Transcript_6465:3848-4633(+)